MPRVVVSATTTNCRTRSVVASSSCSLLHRGTSILLFYIWGAHRRSHHARQDDRRASRLRVRDLCGPSDCREGPRREAHARWSPGAFAPLFACPYSSPVQFCALKLVHALSVKLAPIQRRILLWGLSSCRLPDLSLKQSPQGFLDQGFGIQFSFVGAGSLNSLPPALLSFRLRQRSPSQGILTTPMPEDQRQRRSLLAALRQQSLKVCTRSSNQEIS